MKQILLICLLAGVADYALATNTYKVTSTTDGNGANQLRGAILAADAAGGTSIINVAAGTYNITQGAIVFGNRAENITITGAGPGSAIIQMSSTNPDRIFTIGSTGLQSGVAVYVSGFTFTGGSSPLDGEGGAAIICGGPANVTSITNCVFTGNSISASCANGGGAVNWQGGGLLTIKQCTFTNNSSDDGSGGAISTYYANTASGQGSVSISGCLFNNNKVTSSLYNSYTSGGALSITTDDPSAGQSFSASVQSNSFVNNTLAVTTNGGGGGAIYIASSYATAINYNRFVGNTLGTMQDALCVSKPYGGPTDATNNWWGSNNDPSVTNSAPRQTAYIPAGSSGTGTLTTAPRLLFTVSAESQDICDYKGTNITGSFLVNSAGTTILTTNLSQVIGLPVSYQAPNGVFTIRQQYIYPNANATGWFVPNSSNDTTTANIVVDDVSSTDPLATATVITYPDVNSYIQVSSQAGCTGNTLTFTANASSGDLPITYIWINGSTVLHDGPTGTGSVISGATKDTLTITNTSPDDNGYYYCQAGNGCTSNTSNEIPLTIYGNRLYVAQDGTGNGSSWGSPMGDLTAALQAAASCSNITEIWVKAGLYKPSTTPYNTVTGDPRDVAFTLVNSVSVYGGFAGNETSVSQRNIPANPTILSGDIGIAGNASDNCYHVVVAPAISSGIYLDGFTITGGNANNTVAVNYNSQSVSRSNGGGITLISSANVYNFIFNSTFTGNMASGGGGLFQTNGLLFITNSVFNGNAANYGGAVYNTGSPYLKVISSVFTGNSSTSGGGAALYLNQGTNSLANCVLVNNKDKSTTGGGAVTTNSGSIYFYNNTFYADTSGGKGGALLTASASGSVNVYNNIFYANYGAAGSNDIYNITTNYIQAYNTFSTTNPLFLNQNNPAGPDGVWGTTDDGLQLSIASPDANAGNINYTGNAPTDITGAPRTQGITVDLGAYETVFTPPTGLAYTTPDTFAVASAITPLSPVTTGGAIAKYVLSTRLPAGLYMDSTTGIIAGTPDSASALTNYIITGSNNAGSVNDTIQIAVIGPPTSLSYTTPIDLLTGYYIPAITPATSGGTITKYTISPALPDGLSIDSVGGGIGGVTNAASAGANYIITGSNIAGRITDTIFLGVRNEYDWQGTVDSNWNNPQNWQPEGVPGAQDVAVVEDAFPYNPVVSTIDSIYDLTVENYPTMSVAAGGNLTIVDQATVTSGVLDASAGTINFGGIAPQVITAPIVADTLVVNNPSGVTLAQYGGMVTVTGLYNPVAGTLTTNGNLVLASTPTATAAVGQGTGNYVSGNVTVERYIPAHRAWRFLTAPLSNSGTIFNNWQNAGNFTDSTGVEIWGPSGTGSVGNGLLQAGNAASMQYFDPTNYNGNGGNWVSISNTDTLSLDTTTTSAANNAFAVFVTGPYGSGLVAPSAGDTSTTLIATGQLQTGYQLFSYNNIPAGNFILVGNPYACPVDFAKVAATAADGNLNNIMWAWDAQRAGTSYGGYVTFSYDSVTNGYDQDISPDQTAQTTIIQSGQAIFVQADTTTHSNGILEYAGLLFVESDKVTGNNTNQVFGVTIPASQVRIALNKQNGNTMQAVDGVLVKYDNTYKQGVSDDADKLYNYDENFALRIGTHYLSIERRPNPQATDTLFLDIYALKKNTNYSFSITPQNINLGEVIQPYMVDTYLNTKTPISFTSANTVTFNTTNVAGSYGETRFMIVFANTSALATTITNVKAWARDKGVNVEWSVATEQGIKEYIVEKSPDGIIFSSADTTVAVNNNQSQTYDWFDSNPFDGNNYYRIKVVNKDGSSFFSNVVLVNIKLAIVFKAYPNPLPRGQQLKVETVGMPAGKYTLQIFSSDGKQAMQATLLSDGNSSTQNINLPNLAAGVYQIILFDEIGKSWKEKLIVN